MFRVLKRVVKKIRKSSVFLPGLFRTKSDRPVVILVIWSSKANVRTIQNLIQFFEKDHFVFLILPNPVLWVPFLMYLYPYPYLSLVPGSFFWNGLPKVLVTDWLSFGKAKKIEFISRPGDEAGLLPYFKNPDYCWLYPLGNHAVHGPRPGLVFFAGNVAPAAYGNPSYQTFYGMPNRLTVYRVLLEQPNQVNDDWFDENMEHHCGKLFIHTLGRTSLNPGRYAYYLSRFTFMVCAPGVSMPLCHNLIEAIEAGCIPIFSYPHWMPAGLVHEKNCFVYSNEAELRSILNSLQSIKSERISYMQQNLCSYRDKKLLAMGGNWQQAPILRVINEHKNMIPRAPVS